LLARFQAKYQVRIKDVRKQGSDRCLRQLGGAQFLSGDTISWWEVTDNRTAT